MEFETFFTGRLAGWGVARTLTGRIARRYTLEFDGAWSEAHRALHIDERYTYDDGRVNQRRWAVERQASGLIVGHDAGEGARLTAKARGRDLRLRFDRPRRPATSLGQTIVVMDFIDVGEERCIMLGRVTRLGLPMATLSAALTRAG